MLGLPDVRGAFSRLRRRDVVPVVLVVAFQAHVDQEAVSVTDKTLHREAFEAQAAHHQPIRADGTEVP
jgi:hypothetical protein